MGFIFVFIGIMIALDAAWWIVSLRMTRSAAWRWTISIFMLAQLAGLLWIIIGRMLHSDADRLIPKFVSSSIFLWHFIGLGTLLPVCVAGLFFWIAGKCCRLLAARHHREASTRGEANALTRRKFLGITAALAPPLFNLSLTSIAMAQLSSFRIRRFALPVPGLPRDLDGLTIAHVSDIHVGRFTSGRVLREMVKQTNELRADLVLLTGDLINDALADLDVGLALAGEMHGQHGLCMIEGNHDLIENGPEFERRARASGVPFLLDQSQVLTIHGCQIQLLGLRWDRTRGKERDAAISASVNGLLKQRREDAFPILLAHHPHAFDAAAAAHIPLILSGHTHGGQLMLNDQHGFGPELFRYWSGLYTRGGSRMIVSNGVGNWFPLRINAPAEIVHITLHSVSPA